MARKTKTKKPKNNKKNKTRSRKLGKRFLDGLAIGVSMPGSQNKMTTGSTRTGMKAFNKRAAPTAIGIGDMTQSAKITSRKDGASISGRDFLATVNINGHNSGDVRLSLPINPFIIPMSRMGQLAQIYEKWRVKKLVFHYCPMVGTQTAGQLIHYIDYDVTNTISHASPTNVNIASAHSRSAPFAVWAEAHLPYGRAGQWLYTSNNGADDRWDSCGLYVLLCSSNFDGGNTTVGSVYVEYEIEFFQGQESTPASGTVVTGAWSSNTSGATLLTPLKGTVWNYNSLGLKVYEEAGASVLEFPNQSGYEQYMLTLITIGNNIFSATHTVTVVGASAWTLTIDGAGGTPNTTGIQYRLLAEGGPIIVFVTNGGTLTGSIVAQSLTVQPLPSVFPTAQLSTKKKLDYLLAQVEKLKLEKDEPEPDGPWVKVPPLPKSELRKLHPLDRVMRRMEEKQGEEIELERARRLLKSDEVPTPRRGSLNTR